MLLRASFGMTIILFLTGFVQNIYQFIGLRLLLGVVIGYTTACTTLIATQSKIEESGRALGILSTASVTGALFGPIVGGAIEELFGIRNIFFITGVLMFITFILSLIFVKEEFKANNKSIEKTSELWTKIPEKKLTIILFFTFFIQTLALYSVEPILTIYVEQLSKNSSHISLISGFIFSVSGLASIIGAPQLGKLSDKFGAHKTILFALIISGIIFIPQAFVKNPWQLMVLRFIFGLVVAGLAPSVNVLIKKITPQEMAGRIYGLNVSSGYLGVFSGSLLGGQISGHFGLRSVFFITAALLLFNACLVYFKIYKKFNKESKILHNI